MNSDKLIEYLRETEAMLEGHFILTSGRHSDRYFQCARLLARTDIAEQVGKALGAALPEKPDLIVSPAMGGIVIGHEVARSLGLPFNFTERVEGKMALRRGFAIPDGARVCVIEDVVTSGGSLIEVAELLRGAGATLVAAAAIVDRSGGSRPDFGAPFHSLLEVDVKTWEPDGCPLCAAGDEAVKPGSRHLSGKSGA